MIPLLVLLMQASFCGGSFSGTLSDPFPVYIPDFGPGQIFGTSSAVFVKQIAPDTLQIGGTQLQLLPGANGAIDVSVMCGTGVCLAPEVPGSTIFANQDTTTAGAWKGAGAYGADGYFIVNGPASLPSYVSSLTPSGNQSFTWASSTTDPRGLQTNGDRIAACWYAFTSFTVDVAFNDSGKHQVAVYMVDWDNFFSRAQRIDIFDAAGNLLDSQSIRSFTGGVYLVWNLTGHVTIRFTNTSSPNSNAVLSGIFFDPIPPPPPSSGNPIPDSTAVSFNLRLSGAAWDTALAAAGWPDLSALLAVSDPGTGYGITLDPAPPNGAATFQVTNGQFVQQ